MTDTWDTPVVAHAGSADPTAPLVVLLHGRGADERGIIGLASALPEGPQYAAVRAPIAEGGGYAWFANRGIGRPVGSSLRSTMDWFRAWLDEVAPAGRPVVLIGFSGGAAFAGGLALDDPARYAGLAVSHGTLPFGADLPVNPGRLAHLPTFVAQGDQDQVIPAELLGATWDYLLGDSGAPTVAHRDAGGHGLTREAVAAMASWLGERLHWSSRHDAVPAGPRPAGVWPGLGDGSLPQRTGPRPRVSWTIPQQQLEDQAPTELQERLALAVAALEGVAVEPSRISVPGARGFMATGDGGTDADFLVPGAREFAHLHPSYDGSLHLALPPDLATDVVVHGWGQMHPLASTRLTAGFVLVYGPRDDVELDVALAIVAASHRRATGRTSVRTW